jgi:hypothetical protein
VLLQKKKSPAHKRGRNLGMGNRAVYTLSVSLLGDGESVLLEGSLHTWLSFDPRVPPGKKAKQGIINHSKYTCSQETITTSYLATLGKSFSKLKSL